MTRLRPAGERPGAYWWWFGTALYVLLPLDLLTTAGVVGRYGIAAEANPLVRWLLRRGPVALLGANLVVAVLAVWLFARLLESVRTSAAPYDRYLERAMAAWLKLLVATGLLIQVNNVVLLWAGRSVW